MRYLITIEYDGRPFEGWQTQDGKRTIEGEIESALYRLTGESIKIHGSGRTDSGVHAIGQTAHFDLDKQLDVAKLPRSLNFYLPPEIAIKSAKVVDDTFHARYDVKVKTYLYKIYTGKNRSPLREGRYLDCHYDLDIDKMRSASRALIGEHDFAGLMTLGSSVKTTVRTIYDVDIDRVDDEIYIKISGSGFLYNMVRIIVGTLIDIGRGKRAVSDMQLIVDSADNSLKGPVVSANGLYLYSVEY